MGTPTQKRNCPKRVGTVTGSLRPRIKPTRTNPPSLTYSSKRFVKIAPKNHRCKMLPVPSTFVQCKICYGYPTKTGVYP